MEKIDFKKLVLERKERILNDISKMVKIPSITGTPECQEALLCALQIGKDMGFKTESFFKDTSGHICYGDEKNFIGILGHVDVVPVNAPDWSQDPFSGAIDKEMIHGRGTQDDKGPTIIALHALSIIKDLGLPIKKGVKVIMGTQEEGGDWSDIDNYFKKNPEPECGFTPDSSFPLIYAEKHIVRAFFDGKTSFEKIETFTGGCAINAVSETASVVTKLNDEELKKLVEEFKSENKEAVVKLEGNKVSFTGKSTHAKQPFKGKPAIWDLFKFIKKIEDNAFIDKYLELFCDDHFGKKIGIDIDTIDGMLTINTGQVSFDGKSLVLKFDLRCPNELDPKEILNKLKDTWKECKMTHSQITNGIFKDPNDPIIKTLEKAYRDVTGDMKTELIASGGGTYAKAAPNTVAFGAIFPTDESRVHQIDECMKISSVLSACEIYCEAIYNLVKEG